MNIPHVEVKRESFTLREIEVLGMIAGGLTNQEISQKLHVSTETVKWYAKQIYPKLGVSNRTQAALKADEVGLLEFGKAPLKKEDKTQKSSNFPVQLTSYIGRKKDIAEIKKLISENRVVTLTGPGGIGKTRLALQVASQIHENYRDGVWLVELAHISDPTQVVSTIARVLAVSEREDTLLEKTLKNYLSNKNLLLLIDNFEHLLDVAPFVGELLANAPDLTILTTSRENLHVYGEVEYQVSPLNLPDALQNEKTETLQNYDAISLFIERAQAAKPGYKINEEQIPFVARICKLLDGLPLAIELSAPLVKLYSPLKIAKLLENDLDALPSGPRDLPTRQRTLRATLEWSYDLLNEDEKILLTNHAVFNGGGTLEAIEAINAEHKTGKSIEVIHSLVNRNLLVPNEGRDGEMYFSMLETTRQLNKERLVSNEYAEVVYSQHAEFYLRMAERATREYSSQKNKYWIIRTQTEQNNLRSAYVWFQKNDPSKCLQLANALRIYWRHHGYAKEGLHWVLSGLESAKIISDSLHADTLLTAGDFCLELNQEEKAEQYIQKALELFEQLDDRLNIARCNVSMCIATAKTIDEIPEGISRAQKSLDTFSDLEDKGGMADAYNVLGELSRMGEDFEAAEDFYKKSLQLAKETGELLREGIQYSNMGILAYQKGEYQLAEKLTKKGLRIFLEMDAYYGILYDIGGLAGSALGTGRTKRAAKLLGLSSAGLDSLEVFHQLADRIVVRHILEEIKNKMDEKSFLEAWQEGQRMTVQEAFEYALGDAD